MKICYINSTFQGSTGSICKTLAEFALSNNDQPCFIVANGNPPFNVPFLQTRRSKLKTSAVRLITHLNGSDGFSKSLASKEVIAFLDDTKPDLLHLNNAHGYYLNLEQIVHYAHRKRIPIVWTLHDCWILTGRCACFDFVSCPKWKNGCGLCPHKNNYPRTCLFDCSRLFFKRKRALLSQNKDIVLVSPSQWLKSLVEGSGITNNIFLVPNGIDQEVFKPSIPDSDIASLAKGRIVIGASAFVWNKKKGLEFLSLLAKTLDEKRFLVVALGCDSSLKDKSKIVWLKKTSNQSKMASFYSSLDLFVNFTLEDNFPTVNIESISCGTPVLSFDSGGSCEMIVPSINGYIIKKGDYSNAFALINEIKKKNQNTVQSCILSSQKYSKKIFVEKYWEIYKKVLL